jgi:hypothetical protein
MAAMKKDTGEMHPVNASCEERHQMTRARLKGVVAGVLGAFTAIGGHYLYAANQYATKDQVRELKADLRSDIANGFSRIEKQLDRLQKP